MQSGLVQLTIKRVVDVLASALGLLLLAPLFVLIAIVIRLDSPGPAFFRQERLGRYGKIFQVLKFRTMVVGAPGGMVIDGSKDPRVTRAGAFLRKWSLDEIPQLFNVLKGDMSLVGPRPDRAFRLPDYTERQRQRLLVRPGITGWAQVNGRNAIPWEERYELDVVYVENWSLWLDIKILYETFGVVLGHQSIDAR